MEHEVRFYRYEGRIDLIPKDPLLTLVNSFSYSRIVFNTDERSLLNTEIQLAFTDTLSNLFDERGVNYVTFRSPLGTDDRLYYYFITGVSAEKNIISFQLHLDVLETYKEEIFKLNVVLERAPTEWVKKQWSNTPIIYSDSLLQNTLTYNMQEIKAELEFTGTYKPVFFLTLAGKHSTASDSFFVPPGAIVYRLNAEQVEQFIDFLVTGNDGFLGVFQDIATNFLIGNPADFIVSLKSYPNFIVGETDNTNKEVTINVFGNNTSEKAMDFAGANHMVKLATITLDDSYKNQYIYYPPYTNTTIFLPCVGTQDIDLTPYLLHGGMEIWYSTSYLTGEGLCALYVKDGSILSPIDTFSCQVGQDIPLVKSNIMAQETALAAAAIGAAAGIGGALISGGTSLITGNNTSVVSDTTTTSAGTKEGRRWSGEHEYSSTTNSHRVSSDYERRVKSQITPYRVGREVQSTVNAVGSYGGRRASVVGHSTTCLYLPLIRQDYSDVDNCTPRLLLSTTTNTGYYSTTIERVGFPYMKNVTIGDIDEIGGCKLAPDNQRFMFGGAPLDIVDEIYNTLNNGFFIRPDLK